MLRRRLLIPWHAGQQPAAVLADALDRLQQQLLAVGQVEGHHLALAAGLLGVLAQVWSPDGVFAFLVNASGALILAIYLVMAVSQIRLRRRAIAAPGASIPSPG